MMTKKELEDKAKALREELDKAHAELAELKSEQKLQGVLDEKAVGGYYDKEARQWVISELEFNKETGEAKVVSQRKVGVDFAFFNYEVSKFIAEQINLRSIR